MTTQKSLSSAAPQKQPLEVASNPDALLKLPTVLALTGLSQTHVYRLVAAGKFPAPKKLGPRCTRWRAQDVTAFLRAL